MTASRAAREQHTDTRLADSAIPPLDAPDWLTLQQAACEMGVSPSTVRRLVRGGRLLNRMVPHRGGFAYLVFVPGSRHGAQKATNGKRRRLWLVKGSRPESPPAPLPPVDEQKRIADLETQVEHLSHALSRALRAKQRELPHGIGDPNDNPKDPYARYRWVARRPRWWPF